MSKNHYKIRLLAANLGLKNFFNSFVHNESIGGLLLLVCTIIALLSANVDALGALHRIWDVDAGVSVGCFSLHMSVAQWVNDGLMAIFFFVVGLEIKREMLVGELSSFKHAALPVFAAVGGMLVPALIYSLFNHANPDTYHGWGIPMATDIAFAIGILSLLGKRAPLGLKVFLTALAIVDDLGAILVLAVFYPSHALHPDMLMYAGMVTVLLYTFNRLRVNNVLFYVIPAVFLWYFVFMSGIHATIAGVILAMTIPSRTSINEVRFISGMKYWMAKFQGVSNAEVEVLANPAQQYIIHHINTNVERINPLMHRFEAKLHPWVTFFIMPVFALANAGVVLSGDVFTFPIHDVAKGVFAGLFLGKPIGIFLFSLIAVKAGFAELPNGTRWIQMLALGVIAGIGFTMSIFIDSLAFSDPYLVNVGKVAILGTSVVAASAGLAAIYFTSPKPMDNN